MKHDIFDSMKEQLNPSLQAQAALKEALSRPAKTKSVHWQKYVAVAACAALAISAGPIYCALNPPLHAYAVEMAESTQKSELSLATGGDQGNGIDGTHPILPGGAVITERPVQEEATAAYEALMAQFSADCGPDSYPDWYGGSYIDEWGGLIVCVVGAPAEDKSLYLEIQDMCGDHSVGFRDVTYPLVRLNNLQTEVVNLLKELKFTDQLWVTGVDEEHNQVAVTLPFASKKALAGLHRLDPAGDAIAVTVVERQQVALDKAPAEFPVEMPTVQETPAKVEQEQPAHYDLLPLETPSVANEDNALAIEPVDPGEGISDLSAEKVDPAQSMETPAFSPSGE